MLKFSIINIRGINIHLRWFPGFSRGVKEHCWKRGYYHHLPKIASLRSFAQGYIKRMIDIILNKFWTTIDGRSKDKPRPGCGLMPEICMRLRTFRGFSQKYIYDFRQAHTKRLIQQQAIKIPYGAFFFYKILKGAEQHTRRTLFSSFEKKYATYIGDKFHLE